MFSKINCPLVVTAFVIVKVTPAATVTTTPVLIVKAQAVKFEEMVKGPFIIAFLVASGWMPPTHAVPFQVALEASKMGTLGELGEIQPLALVTLKV